MTPEQLESTREAWRIYAATGRVSKELLRNFTYNAWLRCKTLGTNPRVARIQRLTEADTVALLETEAMLISASRPYLRALSLSAGTNRHMAMVSDAHAILLDTASDEATLRRTTEVPALLSPGMCLSEELLGTGAIGTALAESNYIEVIGPEHLVDAFHAFTCQAIPLRGPDKSVVGAIGIAVKRVEAVNRVREILFCAAHGVEIELARKYVEKDVARVLTDFGDTTSLEKLLQDLTQLPSAVQLKVERAARALGRKPAPDVFHLVSSADALMRRFAGHAALWRELAYDDHGSPQPIDLARRIAEIVELLATEAAVRGVTVDVPSGPAVRVTVDVRTLSRTVLRALFQALEISPAGSKLEIRIGSDERSTRVYFSTGDALEFPHETRLEAAL